MHLPRILFVSYTGELVGPTRSLLLLLDGLRDRFQAAVLARGRGPLTTELERRGIPYESLESLGKGSIMAMARIIRRGRFDLVYGNNTGGSSENALIAARLAGVPFVCHIRAMAVRRGWRRLSFLRFADAAIAVSAACARVHAKFAGVQPYVVHNGVRSGEPLLDPASARARLAGLADIPASGPLILHVSHILPGKGQDHAVRALARIVEREPAAHLLMAGALGRDLPFERRVRGLIAELGLTGRAHFLGFRPDIVEMLPGGTLFLHTSMTDAHPRAVLEAMLAGLPVVAYGVDGVCETVVDGVTGRMVPVGDVDALAAAALDYLAHPARAAAAGAAGRRRVESEFSAESCAGKIADILERTLARRGRRHRARHAQDPVTARVP